jgi:hypothetical protein
MLSHLPTDFILAELSIRPRSLTASARHDLIACARTRSRGSDHRGECPLLKAATFKFLMPTTKPLTLPRHGLAACILVAPPRRSCKARAVDAMRRFFQVR